MAVRPDAKRAGRIDRIANGVHDASCGLGAYAAALWHIAAHGLFKAWLFFGAACSSGYASASGFRISCALPSSWPPSSRCACRYAYLAFTAKVGSLRALTLAVKAAGAATLIAGYGAPASRRARAWSVWSQR